MKDSLWQDSKRYLGMPLSFTKYSVNDGRLFVKSGIFVRKEEQVSLYRIKDLSVTVTLFQRIFRVGTIRVSSADTSCPELLIENIKNPYTVRDIIYKSSEEDKKERRVGRTELIEETINN